MATAMATYAKLKSGEWGIRVPGTVKPGDSVTVVKKSGESKAEKIDKVLWTGNGISLCAIKQQAQHHHRGNWPGQMCPQCGSEPLGQDLSCWECGFQGS